MGERKVLNKYIPADFDPSLVPRGTKLSKKDGTVPVRMMLPFTIQCSTCHTFLYRGRKFNSKKEAMGGPDGTYLGITRWRFYIKCSHCARTLSFLTDPKNADYEMESGGTRNYEVYKDKTMTEEEAQQAKEEDEKLDPMKALENRVLDSQREMADLDNLEQIKAMNKRHLKLVGGKDDDFMADTKAILAAREKASKVEPDVDPILNERGMTEEEEKLVRSIQFGRKNTSAVLRLSERDEELEEERRRKELDTIEKRQTRDGNGTTSSQPKSTLRKIKVKAKRKRKTTEESDKKAKTAGSLTEKAPVPTHDNGLSGLLGGYGSDSDSD